MSNLDVLFNRWSGPLSELGRGHHLNYVMNILNPLYSSDTKIYPNTTEVFKAFHMLEPEDLRVVILGLDPYNIGDMATGYAFSNPEGTIKMSPSLWKIYKEVERTTRDGFYLNFDVTLQHWADQGVLSLNSAFTVEERKPGSHIHIWDKFTKTLISELSRNFEGIHFCFWGKQAQQFAYLVDEYKHNVYSCYHPAYAVRKGIDWECDHFVKINKCLKPPIQW